MPDLLTFSCQFTDIINLDHYDDILRWARRPNLTSNGWKIPARFFHDILKSSGNPFFCDVHSALELHGETSFLTEYLTETGLFPQEKDCLLYTSYTGFERMKTTFSKMPVF